MALLKNQSLKLTTKPAKVLIHWNLSVTYPDPASRTEDLDHGFLVTKKIENLNGNSDIRVGDLVKVTVEFEDAPHRNGKYRRYEYLAMEDPIPAGFIPINTALKNDVAPSSANEEDPYEWYGRWDGGAWVFGPDHFEMHNDRIMAFKDRVWSGRFKFSYFARAICEGTFWTRPSRVSLMYDPEFYGLTQGREIRILRAQ